MALGTLKAGGTGCAVDPQQIPRERKQGQTPAAPRAPQSPSMVTPEQKHSSHPSGSRGATSKILDRPAEFPPELCWSSTVTSVYPREHGRSKERC